MWRKSKEIPLMTHYRRLNTIKAFQKAEDEIKEMVAGDEEIERESEDKIEELLADIKPSLQNVNQTGTIKANQTMENNTIKSMKDLFFNQKDVEIISVSES